MKQNLVMITVDSLSKSAIDHDPLADELFINRVLTKHALNADFLYTQGPYTEASMNGLLFGQQGLDYGSFLYGPAKCPTSLFQELQKQGYQILQSTVFSGIFQNEFRKGCSDFFYSESVKNFSNGYYFRFKEFSARYKNGSLTPGEEQACKRIFSQLVDDGIAYCEDFLGNKPQSCLVEKHVNHAQIENWYQTLLAEKASFLKDQTAYIHNLLDGHCLFLLENYPKFIINNGPEFNQKRDEVWAEHSKKILAEAIRINHRKKWTAKQIVLTLGHLISRPGKTSMFDFYNLFREDAYHRNTIPEFYSKILSGDCSQVKNFPSLNSVLKVSLDWAKKAQNPFGIYLQNQDFHIYSTFYSYDTDDIDLFKSEIDDALALIKRIPRSFTGNLFDVLSLHYVDKKIEQFISQLDSLGLMDNTLFVLTADHGCWTFDNVKRQRSGMLMFEERVHVPFYAYRKNDSEVHDTNLHNSYSVPNTILNLLDLPTTTSFFGKPFSQDQGHQLLLSENLGFGCPDLFAKPILYTVHDKGYSLQILGDIHKLLEKKDANCFYDLVKDPWQRYNIIKKQGSKTYQDEFSKLFEAASARHSAVMKQITSESFYAPPK